MEGLAKTPKSDVKWPKFYKEARNEMKGISSFDSVLKGQLINRSKPN